MIVSMLQSNPDKRPSVTTCFNFPFIKNQRIPSFLPISCLSCEPRVDQLDCAEFDLGVNRRPLLEVNENMGENHSTIYQHNTNFQFKYQHILKYSCPLYRGWYNILAEESTRSNNSEWLNSQK